MAGLLVKISLLVQRRIGSVPNLIYLVLNGMQDRNETSCRSCPMHSSCESAGRDDAGDGLSGWSLAGQSAAYFLLPLAAAIAAAAAVERENMRIAAGVGTFVLTAAAAVIIGLYVRRKREISNRSKLRLEPRKVSK